jgi:hypothetical protein
MHSSKFQRSQKRSMMVFMRPLIADEAYNGNLP